MLPLVPKLGEYIGKYQLLKEIGKGGMASIFEAVHKESGQVCAIKLMLPNQKMDEVLYRFDQEYKALSRLNHPNVLRVFESGVFQQQPYFAMELLKGRILKDEIEIWKNLPPTERSTKARKILLQVASAMDYIHQLGWVHRDITPGNIMVLEDGSVKLMDFGIVKIPGHEFTAVGEMIGTVAYMSPEQIKGEQVDARADLYALGTCLYFMLAGRRPFTARTLPGYLDKHLNHKPNPPQQYAPMVPQDLSFACMRLLEKDPQDRFCSANHLLHFLDSTQEISKQRIVGRTWEISQLRDYIAHLESKKGNVVIIEGVNGMGCTSLMKEARRLSKKSSILSIYTNNQSRSQAAFYGVRTLFRRLGPTFTKNSIINQIFDAEKHFEKWTVFSAIRDLILKSNVRLIAIDNLDNADPGTIELAEYLIRTLSNEVLFLLGVHNSEKESIQGILHGTHTEVKPQKIVLKAISIAAIEELLLMWFSYDESILPLATKLHEQSGGNPTLVHEMIRDLRDQKESAKRIPLGMNSQEIEETQFSLPKDLSEAARHRLSSLSQGAKHVISFIAAYQGRLAQSLLFASIAQANIQISKETVLKALFTLQELSFIEKFIEFGDVLYGMEHNWMRDIIKEHLHSHTPYHIALGKALEKRYFADPGTILEDLAFHFEQGLLYGKAYQYLFKAAKKLRQRTLVEEAERYLNRALSIEPFAREHMILIDAEFRKTELLLEQAMVYKILSAKQKAKDQLEKALICAKKLENDVLLAQIYTEKSHQLRESYLLEEAEEMLTLALTAAQNSGIPRFEIVPYYERGAIQWERGNISAAQRYFRKAQELSQQLNHNEGFALSSNGLGVLAMCQGQSADARRYFEQAIRIGKTAGLIEGLVNARTNLAELHHCMGNFRKALSLVNEVINECREVSHQQGLGIALRYRANLLFDLGQAAEAEENSKTAISIQKKLGNQTEELASIICLLRILIEGNKTSEIQTYLTRGHYLSTQFDAEGNTPLLLSWSALFAHKNNNNNKALDILSEINIEEGKSWMHQQARCHIELARIWLLLSNKEKAEYSAAQALNIADNSGYRFYALLARRILSQTLHSNIKRERHTRIAKSLSKSLSANLSAPDAERFLTRHATGT